jgi:hypothetical protein
MLSSSHVAEKVPEAVKTTAKVERRPIAYITVRGRSFSVTLVHWDAERRQLVFENDTKIWGFRNQLERLLNGSVRSVACYESDGDAKRE